MPAHWTVSTAKAHLSEIMRLAHAGQPQTIGAHSPCVLVDAAYFQQLQQAARKSFSSIGDALLMAGALVQLDEQLELPPRADHRSAFQFTD